MTDERIELQRPIPAAAADIFKIVSDPAGHVAIDATGMLQSFTGEPATKVGDEFVIHMDRESLNDFPLGKYDVTVRITTFEQDKEIAWTIDGQIQPPIGHIYGYRLDPGEEPGTTLVTEYYDWSAHPPGLEGAEHLPDHLGARHPGHARHPRAHGPRRAAAGPARVTKMARLEAIVAKLPGGRARRHRGMGRRTDLPRAGQELHLLRPRRQRDQREAPQGGGRGGGRHRSVGRADRLRARAPRLGVGDASGATPRPDGSRWRSGCAPPTRWWPPRSSPRSSSRRTASPRPRSAAAAGRRRPRRGGRPSRRAPPAGSRRTSRRPRRCAR